MTSASRAPHRSQTCKRFIKARVKTVPPGAWITAAGGWVPFQFAENRLPLQSELDAAAPKNPVLVFQQFTGPASTDTLAVSKHRALQ